MNGVINLPFFSQFKRNRQLELIIFVSVIIHAILLLFDLFMTHIFNKETLSGVTFGLMTDRAPDIEVYEARSKTILEGGVLYRDVYTENPPLIQYLLVLPYVAGGSIFAYQIYFSAFNILSAILIYKFPLTEDKKLEFYASLLFITNPLTPIVAVLKVTDEPVCVFFFLLPIYFLLKHRLRLASLFLAVGFLVKFFPILLLPILLKEEKKWLEKLILLGITSVTIALIYLPFYIIAPDEVMHPIRRYFINQKVEGSGLYTIIVHDADISLPDITKRLLIIPIVLTYGFVFKRNYDPLKSIAIIIIVFLMVYTKVHFEYYLYAIAPISFYVVEPSIKIASYYVYGLIALRTHEWRHDSLPLVLVHVIILVLISIFLIITIINTKEEKEAEIDTGKMVEFYRYIVLILVAFFMSQWVFVRLCDYY